MSIHFKTDSPLPFETGRAKALHKNLSAAALYEAALLGGEAQIAQHGPLVALTGTHTGRSPNDRFLVKRASSEGDIDWGAVNRPISPEHFDQLFALAQKHIEGKELFEFNGYAGADPNYRINVRVVTEEAWHNLFAQNMFLREQDPARLEDFRPDFTVIGLPSLQADPKRHGTNSPTFGFGGSRPALRLDWWHPLCG